jgi:hypothetical protein
MVVLITSLLTAASAEAWRRIDDRGFAYDEQQTCRDGARLGIAFGVGSEPSDAEPLTIGLDVTTGFDFPPPPESLVAHVRGLSLPNDPVSFAPGGPVSAPFSGTFVLHWSRPVDPSEQLTVYFFLGDVFRGTGGLTVQDCALQPVRKEECKNGGWRNFTGFKNQGQCVAFVASFHKKQS